MVNSTDILQVNQQQSFWYRQNHINTTEHHSKCHIQNGWVFFQKTRIRYRFSHYNYSWRRSYVVMTSYFISSWLRCYVVMASHNEKKSWRRRYVVMTSHYISSWLRCYVVMASHFDSLWRRICYLVIASHTFD